MPFNIHTVNSHTHLDRWRDKNGIDYFSNFDEYQRRTGYKHICICALTVPHYGGVEQNIMCALYKLHCPSAFAFGGIVYPKTAENGFAQGREPLSQYRELIDIGFDGIKILYKPDVQRELSIPISSPEFEPMFDALERDGENILWHLADPLPFWTDPVNPKWDYRDKSYPSFRQLFEEIIEVMNRHPRLNVTFAHFMFLSEHTEVIEGLFERFENMSIDVTPGTEMYEAFTKNRDLFKDFFEKHRDRIIFGTDSEPSRGCDTFLDEEVYKAMSTDETVSIWGLEAKGLDLSEGALKKILCENFYAKCRHTPRPIDRERLLGYIEKYSHIISENTLKLIDEFM